MKLPLGISPLSDKRLILGSLKMQSDSLKIGKIKLDDIINDFSKLGVKHLEIILDYKYFMEKSEYTAFLDEVKELVKKHSITLSFHLPIYSIELASWNEKIRKASVEAIVEAINETIDINPLLYVLHPTGPLAAEFTLSPSSGIIEKFLTKIFVKISSKSILEIIRETGIDSNMLAIENDKFPFLAFKEVMNIINTRVCLDTGHILAGISGNVTVDEMFDAFKEYIAEIHVHDGIIVEEGGLSHPKYHLPLGASGYDFRAFFEKLERIGFTGPIVFEMALDDVKKSLQYLGVI